MNKDVADAIKNLRNELRNIGVSSPPIILLKKDIDVLRLAASMDMQVFDTTTNPSVKYYGVRILSAE